MQQLVVNRDPKQIKRDVRATTLCVAAFILTMSIVSVIVTVIAVFVEHPELISQAAQSPESINGSAWARQLSEALVDASAKYAGLASILGMLCGLPWFFLLRGKNFLTKDVTHTNSKAKIGTIALMLVLIMGVQFFMTLVQIGFDLLFSQAGGALTDTLDESTQSLTMSFWGILYIVILGPIFEELVFRGAVMRKLERYGANFAIIVSSLLFGLYHIILFQAVFAFLIGLVLAYTAGRFSLKWSILLHMINNGLATLSVVLNSDLFNLGMSFVYLLAMAATIIILVVGNKRLSAQKIAGAPSEANVYARAFTSPWLITYCVVCVGGGILLLGIF